MVGLSDRFIVWRMFDLSDGVVFLFFNDFVVIDGMLGLVWEVLDWVWYVE